MGAGESFLAKKDVSDFQDLITKEGDLTASPSSFLFNPTARLGSQTVGQVLKLLNDEDVEDTPVDLRCGKESRQAQAAVFGCRDAVRALYSLDATYLAAQDLPYIEGHWFAQKIESVLNVESSEMQILRVLPTDPLGEVVHLMAETKSHRIAIMSAERAIVFLLRQRDVLRYLQRHMIHLKHIPRRKSLADLGVGRVQHVIHVRETDPVWTAFRLCAKYKISSVLVLNEKREIVSSVGVESIRLISSREKLKMLMLPVKEFLTYYMMKNCVDTSATFPELVDMLVKNRWHRIFLTESSGEKCVGVITLADVLAYIFEWEGQPQHRIKHS